MNVVTGHSYSSVESSRFLSRRRFWREPTEMHDPYNMLASLAAEYSHGPLIDCLEVCCGDGLASACFRDTLPDAAWGDFHGIDGSYDLLQQAPKWMLTTQGDAHAALWPEDLDVVLLPLCLYHVDPESIMQRASDSLKPGGVIVASWMWPTSFHEVFKDWLDLPNAWNHRLDWMMEESVGFGGMGLDCLTQISSSYFVNTPSRPELVRYITNSLWWNEGNTIPDTPHPLKATAKFGYAVWRKQ